MNNYLYFEKQTINKPLVGEEKLSWHRADGKLRNFRKFKDISGLSPHSTQGDYQRHLSASGQFDAESLTKIKEVIGSRYYVVVINLRRESCGFIDGKPVSWKDPSYNLGLGWKEIEKDEQKRLKGIKEPYNTKFTERQLVEQLGMGYKRIPILDHHRFSDQAVEDVLSLLRNQGKFTWYHVKCHAGKGRTTQFMAMADMFWNAKKVGFEDILNRQKASGGANFKRHQIRGPNYSQYVAGRDRLKFLKKFYKFCVEQDPHKDSWHSYLKNRSMSKVH